MLNFYDYEVFKEDWLVVIINPVEKTVTEIVNDEQKLEDYYEKHKNEIWIGYNNRRYDQYIQKAVLCGFNPKEISDYIIVKNQHGFNYSSLLRKFPFINFDVMLRTDDGLKTLEGFMGNDIKETDVPFNIDRKLTEDEIKKTLKYCIHDVEQTIEVFLNRKEEFDAKMDLIKIFQLPLTDMGKTNAQLVAKICGGKGNKYDDEFEFPFAPSLRLKKYAAVQNWYRIKENCDYKKKQKLMVAGVPHVFAWGGIHGALKKYYGEGIYILADVTAYYPSLQKQYKWGYRNMTNPENFEKIHDENLRMKALGDKRARLPFKIADNSMSGQLKDQYSSLYDPRDNNAICVNGQLLLLDLIEKIELANVGIQLIQSNTDGILVKLPSWRAFDIFDDIVWEWEQRTGMRMEFSYYTKVFQKDVNNYLAVGKDEKVKTKGAYTKSLSKLDYDLPIVNEAMVAYMTKGTPIETTIRECNELIKFQKLVKLTSKFDYVEHNGTRYHYKCYRVFASKNMRDGQILKCKGADKKDKFGNTPDHCFIDNGNVKDKIVPNQLDRQWYIDMAIDRLGQYGVQYERQRQVNT